MPFDGIRKPHLEQVAAELYSDQMPYHNFNHVFGTLEAAELLVKRCLKESVPINGEVVYFALLFHDAVTMKITPIRALPLRKSILPTLPLSACAPKLFLKIRSKG